ncbi:MAG: TraR/DksA family transcriptional regulator [Xanthomonadales bacterium]|nr:TraR/DksA family transcriptional regulator [Gammaproteobacteria bacterium]MBT8055057.1 TraR/DksA family transcriptional regulator [Gammaproteobacteria bacterium]NND58086.1 TraR/DksA family transcriptional regulator [Xanthomonadales bacterium]NNK51763.1 TraR/DksA family transcriptional regulator [Xanthomonadales bacterium]
MLTEKQRREFKQQLKDRYYDVREEIRLELLRSDNEHFIDLAGLVHDPEEESVADLLVDIDLALVDMHVEQIRDIDAALIRLAEGIYDVCLDCGKEIVVERLQAYPTAKRCTRCQTAYERSHMGHENHTM